MLAAMSDAEARSTEILFSEAPTSEIPVISRAEATAVPPTREPEGGADAPRR